MKEPKILKLYGKNVGKSWRQGGREDLKSYAPLLPSAKLERENLSFHLSYCWMHYFFNGKKAFKPRANKYIKT